MRDVAEEIGHERVARVVEQFYAAVRQHPALGVPFGHVTDWTTHEHKLTHFWWVSLGGTRYLDHRYKIAERHAAAGFSPDLLVVWLNLFADTLEANLPRPLAQAWLERAHHLGKSLVMMHTRQHSST